MKTYLATRFHKGKDICTRLQARNEDEAELMCLLNGWRYDGELIAEIPADETTVQQVADMCERRNKGAENDA